MRPNCLTPSSGRLNAAHPGDTPNLSRRRMVRHLTGALLSGVLVVPALSAHAQTKTKDKTKTSTISGEIHPVPSPHPAIVQVDGQTEVWFSYTATQADVDYWGEYTPQLWANTFSDSEAGRFPTTLTMYSSRNGKLTQIGYSDGTEYYGGTTISSVTFPIEAGTTYFFKVTTNAAPAGAELWLNVVPPPG